MANTPEIQKNNVPEVSKSLSDTLLKNFRATLDMRWSEFDKATMAESKIQADKKLWIFSMAVSDNTLQEERNKDPEFIKAKNAFDAAKSMLESIQNDTDLRANTQVLTTVESTLKSITDHLKALKPEEKGKTINIILAKTTADLSQFRADITGKASDKQEAETAIAAEKAIPRAVVVAATTTGWFSLISSVEAKTTTDEIKNEIGGELKKELGPWGMIFRWVKDVPSKEVAIQIKDLSKEYSEKKWIEDPFDKFFSMIKLFFLKWQVGRAGMDLSKDMTPEEMKLAGIKGKVEDEKYVEKPNEDLTKKNQEKNYSVASTILTEVANTDAQKWGIASIYPLSAIRSLKYSDIKNISSNPIELRKKLGVGKDITDMALVTFAKPIVDESHSLHKTMISSYQRTNPWKKIEDATIYEIIASVGPGIRTLATMKKIDITDLGGTTEELATSFIKVDTDSGELSGELVAQAEWLGLSKKLLKVLFANRKWKFMQDSDLATLLQNPELTPDEKIQIWNIRTFGLAFQQKLISDTSLNFWNGNVVQDIVNKWGMNIGDVLKSYVLTWGKTDFSQMTAIEKVWAYTSFFLITGADPEWAGALTGSLINMENIGKLIQWESVFDKIPKDVQKIMEEHFGIETAMKKVWQLAWWATETLGWFAKKSPGFAAILTICVLFLPAFSKRTNLVSILMGKK